VGGGTLQISNSTNFPYVWESLEQRVSKNVENVPLGRSASILESKPFKAFPNTQGRKRRRERISKIFMGYSNKRFLYVWK
jgi:hypothetical protein